MRPPLRLRFYRTAPVFAFSGLALCFAQGSTSKIQFTSQNQIRLDWNALARLSCFDCGIDNRSTHTYYVHSITLIVAMPPKTNQPSDLELQLLSVLWEKGPSTVREVLANLSDGKTRAYTTILTVMQNLERKGLVKRTSKGTAHVYHPPESQKETLRPVMTNLLQNIFRGRASRVMQHLLEDGEVSEEELKEIRQLIDKRQNDRNPKSP